MAIIVDKEQKKRDIALACKELFLKNNLQDLLISNIAKEAGVGKGTIYNYFSNKEEILFELVNILLQEHDVKKMDKLSKGSSTKEKIKIFSSFFYDKDDTDLREIYKKFIAIALGTPNQAMKDFQTTIKERYMLWMEEIIQAGIDKGEIVPESKDLISTICTASEGLFIASHTTNTIDDLEEQINLHIDTIFGLIKVDR